MGNFCALQIHAGELDFKSTPSKAQNCLSRQLSQALSEWSFFWVLQRCRLCAQGSGRQLSHVGREQVQLLNRWTRAFAARIALENESPPVTNTAPVTCPHNPCQVHWLLCTVSLDHLSWSAAAGWTGSNWCFNHSVVVHYLCSMHACKRALVDV